MDTPARIAMLRSQIKGLLKKIHTLRKALMEATDPKERLAIMKQIIDMQAQVSMAEAQIAELQLRAKRRGQPLPEPAPDPEEQDKWRDKWEDAYGPA
jgi:predicted  nucleic acid-binding Zn-ribbon protein